MSVPRRTPLIERLGNKFVFAPDGCWLWTSGLYVNGYGAFWIGGRGGQNRRAHRVVYELVNGAIHEGLELDHLCRVRHCVNPAHLEPVTRGENLRRGPRVTLARLRCPRGHDLTDDNSYLEATGYRRCRLCERARARRRREAMKSRMEMTR